MDPMAAGVFDLLTFPMKQRNLLLDSWFYDVEALTPEERLELTGMPGRQDGAVVAVSPRVSREPIRHYQNTLRYWNHEGRDVEALVIAGVGCSALGSAALARAVADACCCDAAGLVTGYGMADMAAEALGGWLCYGVADRLRQQAGMTAESLAERLREVPAKWAAMWTEAQEGSNGGGFEALHRQSAVPGDTDAGALLDLLLAQPRRLRLLVAHGRGALLASFVLGRLVEELDGEHHPYYDRLSIVTLGTVAHIPKQFRNRHQFLGEWDWFGGINSRYDEPFVKVPKAWHHLNSHIPFHLPVEALLKEAIWD